MKKQLNIIAWICLLIILLAGILFAAGTLSSAALKTTALAMTIGWFALRLIAASRPT